MEAYIPLLLTRYRILKVTTLLQACESVVNRSMFIFTMEPALFYILQWPRFYPPQSTLVQSFISPLRVLINMIPALIDRSTTLEMTCNNIFPKNDQLFPSRPLNRLLEDHLAFIQLDVIIATDVSQCEENSDIGIYSASLI